METNAHTDVQNTNSQRTTHAQTGTRTEHTAHAPHTAPASSHSSHSTKTLRRKVPELSLMSYIEGSTNDRTHFIDHLAIGLKEYGFIVLKDHPIPDTLLNNAYAMLEELFALDTETKTKYALKDQGYQRGYTPFGQEHAKDSPVMDLKEFWHVGRELPEEHRYASIYPKNIWPAELPDFKPIMTKIYSALDEAGKTLLGALTYSLDLSPNYFTKMMSEGNSILRLLHYPPIPDGVDPRCVRSAAHEDINLITILVAATQSGLQLKDRDGTWLDVESDPNALIVDAGDMLARLTNLVIPATTHRVINPVTPVNPVDSTANNTVFAPNATTRAAAGAAPSAANANTARYSMPYFIHPNPDAMLSCLPSCRDQEGTGYNGKGEKFPPISAQDFLMERLREIGLIK